MFLFTYMVYVTAKFDCLCMDTESKGCFPLLVLSGQHFIVTKAKIYSALILNIREHFST